MSVEEPERGILTIKRSKGRDSIIVATNLSEKPYILETEQKYKVFGDSSKVKNNNFEIAENHYNRALSTYSITLNFK